MKGCDVMESKRMMRYYCDHCRKYGGSKCRMLDHELVCFHNPDRVCQTCKEYGIKQLKPIDFRDILDASNFDEADYDTGGSLIAEILKRAETLGHCCPACIVSIVILAELPFRITFNYSDALDDFRRENSTFSSNAIGTSAEPI